MNAELTTREQAEQLANELLALETVGGGAYYQVSVELHIRTLNAVAQLMDLLPREARETRSLSCDYRCDKAWGVSQRPRVQINEADLDDFAFLSDDELGVAPVNPGTYEGGHGKPRNGVHNKWCYRECERSYLAPSEKPDFSRRVYNKPQD